MPIYHRVTGGCGPHGTWGYLFTSDPFNNFLEGGALVAAGYNQGIVFVPDSGYTMDTVTDTAAIGALQGFSSYGPGMFVSNAVSAIASNHSIYGTFKTVATSIITASAGVGGSINPTGSQTIINGTNKTFYFVPNNGYSIDYVRVDGVNVGSISSYTFGNVQASHSISVSFTSTTRTITASAGSGGYINPVGSVGVTAGQSKSFAISPYTGYEILDVLVDGVSVGKVSYYTFNNVISDHTITATFKLFDSFLITASAGLGGSIDPIGSTVVVRGTNKTFTITPNTHSDIADVLVDGVSVGAVSSYTFTNITVAHTIAASFSSTPYIITATAGPHGSIVPSGEIYVYYGDNKSFVITPDEEYQIQDVFVDGVRVTIPASGILFIE